MKPSRLNEHFLKKHPDKNNKDILYFQELKKTFESRNTLSNVFNAQIMAKCGAPHTYGEKLILPAIRVFINNMIGQNQQEILSSVPLSNDTVSKRIDEMANDITVSKRIDEMANDIEIQLCDELQSNEFSLQLDEIMDCNEEIIEEMLFSKLLNTDTKGSLKMTVKLK
ncbi:protein FAM200C-like [Arctopsyche grandis]|uniref:protein FAM200C-like n=1 Tax=Arctopsyche grandis TaxID=121162 RepID=UPI00406D7E83